MVFIKKLELAPKQFNPETKSETVRNWTRNGQTEETQKRWIIWTWQKFWRKIQIKRLVSDSLLQGNPLIGWQIHSLDSVTVPSKTIFYSRWLAKGCQGRNSGINSLDVQSPKVEIV